MTQRELLIRIRDISDSLSAWEEKVYIDQADVIQANLAQWKNYSDEIKELSDKLESPRENYAIYSTKDAEAYLQKIRDRIANVDVEIAQNDASLSTIEQRIKLIDSEVAHSRELIEIGKMEETNYNNIDTTDKSAEEIAEIQDKIQRTKAAVEDIDAYAQELSKEKEELLQTLEALNTKQTQLVDSKTRYQATADRIEPSIQQGEILDEKQIAIDRARLEQLQSLAEALNVKQIFLAYNASNSLRDLEQYIRTGDVSVEFIVERLREIQARIPSLPENAPAEVYNNQETQTAYTERIKVLETKLSDDQNYVLSSTHFEDWNRQIIALELKLSDYESKIKENEADYIRMMNDNRTISNELEANYRNLADLEAAIARLKVTISDPNLSKALRREQEKTLRNYQKEVDNIRKIISELYEEQNHVQTMLQSIQDNTKRLPKLYNATKKVLDQKRKRLEDSSTLDLYAKRMDEDELHDLTSGLESLQNREKFLLANRTDKLDTLINTLEQQGLTKNSEKIKQGFKVVFDKVNEKVIQKIKNHKFTTRMKAFFAASILLVTSGCYYIMKNDSVKLNRKGLSLNSLTMKDALPVIHTGHLYQIQLDGKTYELEEKDFESVAEEITTQKVSIDEVVMEVIRGKWGNGEERKDNLRAAGYTDEEIAEIQARVNAYYHTQAPVVDKSEPIVENPVEEDPTPVVDNEVNVATPDPEPTLDPQPVIDANLGEPVLGPEDLEVPEVEPDELIPGTITPGPVYTIDGDEEFIGEEFHPITPEPSQPSMPDQPSEPIITPDSEPIRPSRPSHRNPVIVKPGDTLIVETKEGPVAVDNSEGANFQDLGKDVSLDYTSSDAVDGVKYNDADGSVEVSVNPDEVAPAPETPVTEDQAQINQQILDDYEQILREMGISSTAIENTGRTR